MKARGDSGVACDINFHLEENKAHHLLETKSHRLKGRIFLT